MTNYDGTACSPTTASSLDYGPLGNPGGGSYTFVGPANPPATTNQNVAVPDTFDNVPPLPPPSTFTSAGAALDSSGNWKPGTYSGFAPDTRGKLNPGVYKLVNNGAVDLSGLTPPWFFIEADADTDGNGVFTKVYAMPRRPARPGTLGTALDWRRCEP